MKVITIIILITAIAAISMVMVISLWGMSLFFITPTTNNQTSPIYGIINVSNTSYGVWIDDTFEIRYKDPKDIPDCEYLSGKYLFGVQGNIEGMMLGYMVCEGEKPYHYEMILNNVTTHESYWVKREGGNV